MFNFVVGMFNFVVAMFNFVVANVYLCCYYV